MKTFSFRLIFWTLLIVFIGWDAVASPPINVRLEPPLIAAGSGQASTGGHCSSAH
ncbi:hypothetical protein [Paralcaligenes ureilyticus]|uniref:hypothetical protein n=1 Tax=Paralcaligenes ureilyticus TaxID=627131 RepID=UPI001404F0B8|nr:hypothetical protein [Paralcaligenes ureilyticus]